MTPAELAAAPPEPAVPALSEQVAARLLYQRIVVLDGELDDAIGTRLCSQIFLLSAEDPHADISLWINSPGGSIPAMLAIMDTMRLVPNDVSTLVLGLACSAGQFLLTAGTPGKRYALPHARVLMHQGSSGFAGTAVDIELQADNLRYIRDTVLGLVAQYTGQPLERVQEDSLRDRWYTAEEAREYGFVDHILESLDVLRPPERRPMGLVNGR
ncbi:MAG TPA: ATP-dependent Clp protease proteolytic subunit [Mycobacteriales bacterium]|nr:ATP-dependent Clp protease proteolytic subunit [Mycobacteriales bacterium]